MSKTLEILPNLEALQQRAVEIAIEEIQAALKAKGECSIVLAGGSTPKPIYEALAQQNLPWTKIQIFWGDERYVEPNDPQSNQRMARQAWLDQVDLPASNIHPMPTQAGNPWEDAQTYEQELRRCLEVGTGKFPEFDLIFLGMGDDGHTASLFPYTAALGVKDHWVTVGEKDGQPRLTLTVPVINAARCVVFLVTGANKKDTLVEVLQKTGDGLAYPARLIQPQGRLWWLIDQAAGAKLS